MQYVAWNYYSDSFYASAADTSSNQELLLFIESWLSSRDYTDVDDTIGKLEEYKDLNHHQVLQQAISAYRREDYDLAVLGFTTTTDRLLSTLSGRITDVSIERRVKTLWEKIKENGDAYLNDSELREFILISTYTSAMGLFGESAPFNKTEPDLSRHWIAHGRMDRKLGKIDCIRLINILYGTVLMGRLSEYASYKDNVISI